MMNQPILVDVPLPKAVVDRLSLRDDAIVVTRLYVSRMVTSRTDETKYEHFVMLVNSAGKELSLYMRHNPVEALFQAHELAQFMDLPVTPLMIDGEEVQLDEISKLMLRKD